MKRDPHTGIRRQRRDILHGIVAGVFLIYVFLPLGATFLFSISSDWQNTILPRGFTGEWFLYIFTEERFLKALGRSVLISVLAVSATLAIMIPTVFIVTMYFQKWERLLQAVVLIPFAIPSVVLAVGVIKLYSSGPFAISGTIWILLGVYFIVILPYVYQSIRNSLQAINAVELTEAAAILGAGKRQTFMRVILPNIMPGILIASLLSFAIIFSEFVLVNILVGGTFETIQIYLLLMMQINGHVSSATIVIFYAVVFTLSGIVLHIGGRKPKAAKTTAWIPDIHDIN